MTGTAPDTPELIDGSAGDELSANRTEMAFTRTAMADERTLMAVIRTALSLISFGFTIAQLFHSLRNGAGAGFVGEHTARNFGLTLILLGVALLAMGVASHMSFHRGLTQRRNALHGAGLLRSAAHYHATPTFIIAMGLIVVGVVAAFSLIARALGVAS